MPKISNLPEATVINSNDLFVVVDRTTAAVTKKATAELAATRLRDIANCVKSDTSAVAGSEKIVNIVMLTQAQYDGIENPQSDTLYVIKN